jgi:predicted dehydrogenase
VERVRPVRIGLVGYGKGGRFFHAPLIAAAAGCELSGVVTRSTERAGPTVPGVRHHRQLDVGAFDGQADQLMAGGSPAEAGDAWGVVPRERWGRLHAGHTTRPWPGERGDWTVFYTSFAHAVRGHGAVPVDPWDAVAGLEVLEAAHRSAATGQVVAVDPGTATR